eukprot:TRINITY_DN2358_c0_g1_i3.p1 TRINITY_DN2358_c0_g1~~TRINITY_DN2358_c0_g1_i3.p1  ORF type:complete len:861 (+),score=112.85 TRINITY_DN2358_c0_g1_i3:112-2694(+)
MGSENSRLVVMSGVHRLLVGDDARVVHTMVGELEVVNELLVLVDQIVVLGLGAATVVDSVGHFDGLVLEGSDLGGLVLHSFSDQSLGLLRVAGEADYSLLNERGLSLSGVGSLSCSSLEEVVLLGDGVLVLASSDVLSRSLGVLSVDGGVDLPSGVVGDLELLPVCVRTVAVALEVLVLLHVVLVLLLRLTMGQPVGKLLGDGDVLGVGNLSEVDVLEVVVGLLRDSLRRRTLGSSGLPGSLLSLGPLPEFTPGGPGDVSVDAVATSVVSSDPVLSVGHASVVNAGASSLSFAGLLLVGPPVLDPGSLARLSSPLGRLRSRSGGGSSFFSEVQSPVSSPRSDESVSIGVVTGGVEALGPSESVSETVVVGLNGLLAVAVLLLLGPPVVKPGVFARLSSVLPGLGLLLDGLLGPGPGSSPVGDEGVSLRSLASAVVALGPGLTVLHAGVPSGVVVLLVTVALSGVPPVLDPSVSAGSSSVALDALLTSGALHRLSGPLPGSGVPVDVTVVSTGSLAAVVVLLGPVDSVGHASVPELVVGLASGEVLVAISLLGSPPVVEPASVASLGRLLLLSDLLGGPLPGGGVPVDSAVVVALSAATGVVALSPLDSSSHAVVPGLVVLELVALGLSLGPPGVEPGVGTVGRRSGRLSSLPVGDLPETGSEVGASVSLGGLLASAVESLDPSQTLVHAPVVGVGVGDLSAVVALLGPPALDPVLVAVVLRLRSGLLLAVSTTGLSLVGLELASSDLVEGLGPSAVGPLLVELGNLEVSDLSALEVLVGGLSLGPVGIALVASGGISVLLVSLLHGLLPLDAVVESLLASGEFLLLSENDLGSRLALGLGGTVLNEVQSVVGLQIEVEVI